MGKYSRFSKAKYKSFKIAQEELISEHSKLHKEIFGANRAKIDELREKNNQVDDIDTRKEINEQIKKLRDESITANSKKYAQLEKIYDRIKTYQKAIYKVLNRDTKKFFERYSKELFDLSIEIIANYMPDTAIKFEELSAEEKLDFLQTFLNHFARHIKVVPNKLILKDSEDGLFGFYEPETDNIYLWKNSLVLSKLQDTIGILLHEFTHYLYCKYPKKVKIGEQKVNAIIESADISRSVNNEEYKKRPHEAPAYYVEEYFKKHKFTTQLLLKIKTIQHISNLEHQ